MLYLSWSPVLFLCTVVMSFDLDAYSVSRRAQGDEYDDTGVIIDICICFFVIYQTWKLRFSIGCVSLWLRAGSGSLMSSPKSTGVAAKVCALRSAMLVD